MSEEKSNNFIKGSLLYSSLGKVELQFLNSGKKLRSKLIDLLSYNKEIDPASLTLIKDVTESVHNATLIHDDVIDESDFRRALPTFPNKVGNHQSILVGDYLLANCFFKLSTLSKPELISAISICLGKLVEGEWIQYDCRNNHYEMSQDIYKRIAINKTGSLFNWCFQSVAILSGESYEVVENIVLGEELGYLYQIYDDLMDFCASSDKTLFSDYNNNELNFVILNKVQNKMSWEEALNFSSLEFEKLLEGMIANLREKTGNEKLISYVKQFFTPFNQKFSIPEEKGVPI